MFMFKEVLKAIIGWVLIVPIRLFLVILGLPLVALGLLFKQENFNTSNPFTQHNKHRDWWHVGLPKFLWIWSNDREGAKGDKRGWWDKNCPTGNSEDFYSQWIWMAVRNPANNLRFTPGFSVNLADHNVIILGGKYHVDDDDDGSGLGWQFCKVDSGIGYYSFYYLSNPMPDWLVKIFPSLKDHVFQFRIGHKIKPRYNEQYWLRKDSLTEDERHSAWKGFTFRCGFLDYKN